MICQEFIDYVIKHKIQSCKIVITKTEYSDGDHDCVSTDNFDLMRDDNELTIYIDDNL